MNRKHRAAVEAMERRILLSASLVKDIVPGPLSSQPHDAVSAGSSLYFFAADTATESGPSNTNLFKTDGTAAGTVELRKIPQWVGNLQPVNDNGTLYYVEDNSGQVSDFRLWKSNGTSSGTVQVADLGSQLTAQLTVVGTTLYFVKGTEVWKTDPTSNSAVQAFAVPDQSIPPVLGTYAGKLLVDNFPSRLYTYNGATLTPIGPAASETAHLELFSSGGEGRPGTDVLGGALYYLNAEHDPNAASQYIPTLYRADGSPNGATVVKTFAPFQSGEDYPVTGPWAAGGKLLFSLNNQLYASDGTSPGTVLLSSNLMLLNGAAVKTLNGQAYFVTLDTSNYIESLWKTDGTPAGTVLVKDDIAGPNGASPALTVYHGRLYFTASSQEQVLWETDGTTAGTHPVNGITYPSTFTSQMRTSALGIANDTLYFTAPDPAVGNELFALTTPSQPLLIQGTGGNDTISVSLGTGGTLVVDVNGTIAEYPPAEYSDGIKFDSGMADTHDTLSIAGLPAVPVTVDSGGVLNATLGTDARALRDISSTSLTLGTLGTLNLTINDAADPVGRHVTLGTTTRFGNSFDVLSGPTQGDIIAAAQQLVVDLGPWGNTVDVFGTASSGGAPWRVVNLNVGAGDDIVNVSGTGPNTVLNINGQSGHDAVNVSDPMASVQSVLGVVNVSNPRGKTTLMVDDNGDMGTRSMTLDTFAAGGTKYGSFQGLAPGPINFAGTNVDRVSVFGPLQRNNILDVNDTPGGGVIFVSALGSAVVRGTAAGQELDLERAFLAPVLTETTVDFTTGRIGANSHILADTEVVSVRGSSPTDVFTGSGFEHQSDGASVGFVDLDIDQINFSNGTWINSWLTPPAVALSLGPDATMTLGGVNEMFNQISVSAGSSLTVDPTPPDDVGPYTGRTLTVVGHLSLSGKLDLTNNHLVLSSFTSLDQVRSLIRQGLGGVSGITSSLADASHNLGYAPAALNSTRVSYALYGDANLDGTVGFQDLLVTAMNYGHASAANWYQGDFNYDGKVDFADLLKLAQNYGKSLASTAAAAPVMGFQPSAPELFKLRKHRWRS